MYIKSNLWYQHKACKETKSAASQRLRATIWWKTSGAQDKTSGKFKFFWQKNSTKNFESIVQALMLKGELQFFWKTGNCSQNQSVECSSLFVCLGMFPHDFCGGSQLPV